MGQRHSTLQQEELIYFTKNTPFSSSEIERLYKRFQQLDRHSLGSIHPEDLLSIPELAMNPLSKHIIDFLFKPITKTSDEIITTQSSNGMDFESFVDAMSVFHKSTSLEIKFKYFFKLLISSQTGGLTEKNFRIVIDELCGPISNNSRKIILEKTFKLFSSSSNGPVSEELFVNCQFTEAKTRSLSQSIFKNKHRCTVPGVFLKMESPIPNSGLVLLVHPLEISSSYILKNIFTLKSWTNIAELKLESVSIDNLSQLDFSQYQALYFDLSQLIYSENFQKSSVMAILRKIESSILKKQIIVFASLRNTLLCNEYLYLISKAVILSESESEIVSEERFAEPSSSINVSILSKPGSGKLEVDDRFEFDFYEGFKIRTVKSKALNLGETPGRPSSTFNMERKNPNEHVKFTDAKIFVEDSDRDSDNEMEADADF